MKKVNFKNALMTLSVALAFLFLGMGQAGAQSQVSTTVASGGAVGNSLKTLMITPTGNFVAPANALAILEDHKAAMKDQFSQLTPGSATYNALEREYAFYCGIYDDLLKGSTVPLAIMNSLVIFNQDIYPTVTDTVRLSWKQAAIDLLKI